MSDAVHRPHGFPPVWPAGVAARSFGLDQVAYANPDSWLMDKSTGYFERKFPNVDMASFCLTRIHAQEANRDNLFLGYIHKDENYGVGEVPKNYCDMFQITP